MATAETMVIINPIARRGRSLRAWQAIQPVLQQSGCRYQEAVVTRPFQARDVAEQATDEGFETVLVIGGDGTLHQVINGILRARPDHPPALAIIPAGTANIFARALGLPDDPVAAARLLLEGTRRRIDAGQVNDRYFATVAGVGFDSVLVGRASGWPRWIEGKKRHVAAGLLTLATYRAPEARVWLDGREHVGRLFLLAAANTDWYGGGVHIAPHARIDDGRLSVIRIGAVGLVETVVLLVKSFSGRHLGHVSVAEGDAAEIRVESDPPLPVQVDGEIAGATPATIRCVPGALEVMVPSAG